MEESKILGCWPWQRMGTYKYHLFLPIFLSAAHSHYLGTSPRDNWCFHILVIAALRYALYQAWSSFARLHAVVKHHQIISYALTYEQVDREFDCDNGIILHSLLAYALGPNDISGFSIWNLRGLVYLIAFHAGVTESAYYWLHRAFHTKSLFRSFHSYHHASTAPEPATAFTHTFLEALLQTVLMSVPIFASCFLGGSCLALFYVYPLAFDFFKYLGHFNCEIVPLWAFQKLPLLKYLIYTPSYHSLHHLDLKSNFCLFMPLYDYLGGTQHPNTHAFYRSIRKDGREAVPQFVFLVHCIDILSSLHVAFSGRTASSVPFRGEWYAWLVFPIGLVSCFCVWIWGKTFVATKYLLDGLHAQSWVVPRYGFHYFIPACAAGINRHIERAILDADELGVKVISLAALNKNESLNGGGLLFVKKHPNLKVRVVHGNTLTAALVLRELPAETSEVFLTGSTSKIGRAIALYLCRRNVRIMMLTTSRERYQSIVDEAPADCRHNLVQVTKYQAGQTCKTWIVGKWATSQDQSWAPHGSHFHQFVVPPVHEYRKDCTYGKLAGMKLPQSVEGVHSCEYTFDRGVVAACHAGGLVHALENWTHHEVGSIDIDHIDLVWEAALKHGLEPVL
ncbi:hypothetical protein SELMODRAFT_164680 [Selaginella moellendorffii]|uniref:Uncharacterized protein WAX2B-1 n=1 Tax=Selaginella moellendorffii TaxID=88036 RepID=D8QTP4_SELML|nr:protein ECERIFERUM 3 [Selaginella moellendorffii]EFJ36684.1 hypothetical protein SELMODRAFT_164680 [Selaginella moellendorffii]|eukprot:XP_002961424.1 protein ECERIFERUM 3 [Selaginella moellendorffii]